MKWNYNVDKAPLNIGLLCYCDNGLKLLVRQNEKYGVLRNAEDKKEQEYRKAFREYLDGQSRTYNPHCWMVPNLPDPNKIEVKNDRRKEKERRSHQAG